MKGIPFILLSSACLSLGACATVHVDPIEVKPITININLRMVDKELDDVLTADPRVPAKAPTDAPTNPQK